MIGSIKVVALSIGALLAVSTAIGAGAQDTIEGSRRVIEAGKEREPRPAWIEAVLAFEESGKTLIRADRNPDGSLRRCVRTARYRVTDKSGLQAFEIGVERNSVAQGGFATMYARLRYVARRDGPPLAIREPTMQLFTGPTRDWTVSGPDGNGWVRMSRPVVTETYTEQLYFLTVIERGTVVLIFSLPDGSLKIIQPIGYGDAWRFNIFARCACELLRDIPAPAKHGFPCD